MSLAVAFVCGFALGMFVARRFAIPHFVKLLVEGVRLNSRAEKIISDLEQDNDRLRGWVKDVLPAMEIAAGNLRRNT